MVIHHHRKIVGTLVLALINILQMGCGTSTVNYPIHIQKQELVHLDISDDQSITHPVFVFTAQSTLVNDHTKNIQGQDSLKPPVLLLHELPGLSSKTLWYADVLAKHFTVYVPLLFGSPNSYSAPTGLFAYAFNGEWKDSDSPQGSRPIIQWLKEVVKFIDERHQGKQKIGIIGMCLTGSLPLALLDHSRVKGVVVAQPSLPLIAITDDEEKSLGISDVEAKLAKSRVSAEAPNGVRIYGVRFEKDTTAKRAKHLEMKDMFKHGFIDREIRNTEYKLNHKEHKLYEIPDDAHSTLIIEWENFPQHPSQIRREEIVRFLQKPLQFSKDSPPIKN